MHLFRQSLEGPTELWMTRIQSRINENNVSCDLAEGDAYVPSNFQTVVQWKFWTKHTAGWWDYLKLNAALLIGFADFLITFLSQFIFLSWTDNQLDKQPVYTFSAYLCLYFIFNQHFNIHIIYILIDLTITVGMVTKMKIISIKLLF